MLFNSCFNRQFLIVYPLDYLDASAEAEADSEAEAEADSEAAGEADASEATAEADSEAAAEGASEATSEAEGAATEAAAEAGSELAEAAELLHAVKRIADSTTTTANTIAIYFLFISLFSPFIF